MRLSPALLAVMFGLAMQVHVSAQAPREGVLAIAPTGVRTDAASSGQAWHGRAISTLAGGLLGAGLGYFASQVVTGDWDDDKYDMNRGAWAAVGGSLGLVLGFSIPHGGRGTAPPVVPAPRDRAVITSGEIRGMQVTNAYDVVQLLRPWWLNQRGTNILGEQRDETIAVYLDGTRVGGIPALREMRAEIVHSIRFMDPAAATFRFGAGHSHGAILVVSGDDEG